MYSITIHALFDDYFSSIDVDKLAILSSVGLREHDVNQADGEPDLELFTRIPTRHQPTHQPRRLRSLTNKRQHGAAA